MGSSLVLRGTASVVVPVPSAWTAGRGTVESDPQSKLDPGVAGDSAN